MTSPAEKKATLFTHEEAKKTSKPLEPEVEQLILAQLSFAIIDNKLEKFTALLNQTDYKQFIDKPINPSATNITALSLLHLAVSFNRLEFVKCLVEKGAKIDNVLKINASSQSASSSTLYKGCTPSYIAGINQQKEIVEYLLAAGADPDYLNVDDIVSLTKNKNASEIKKIVKNKAFSKKKKDELKTTLKNILEKEYAQAKKYNKKLIILIGEAHNYYSIFEFEKIILKAAKAIGVNHLYAELPQEIFAKHYNGDSFETYAKNKSFSVTKIDNHPYRNSAASVQERNIVMAQALHESGVFVGGAAHLQGFLEKQSAKIDPNQFHVVPFNLARISSVSSNKIKKDILIRNQINETKLADSVNSFYHKTHAEQVNFSLDSKKVIQVSKKKISDLYHVIKRWNTETPFTPKPELSKTKRLINRLMVLDKIDLFFIVALAPLALTASISWTLLIPGATIAALIFGAASRAYIQYSKTHGLKSYLDKTSETISDELVQKLEAFMHGVENKTTNDQISSFFSPRDWYYMRDYYAGQNAKETEETTLIESVKSRLSKVN